ncbi:MAG: ion transporter [Bacteroidales bacterium]|nr:ion transporter [Bacteroidales bacterium]
MSLKQRWQELMANQPLKHKLYEIIFGSDTPMGKSFDLLLMVCILLSIFLTIFDSLFTNPWLVGSLVFLEYALTLFFTFEYLARLYCSPRPKDYALSFFGIIDLISILPMYLGWLLPGARFVIVLRSIRLIRVFRVFKLFSFLDEGYRLMESLRQSFKKIFVFFLFVLILVICLGTIMYMVEGNEPDTQFTDIPTSIYWAIVTMTTVGYGDITPVTPLGRFFASIVMLLGYTIIAVPTGIVSSEMVKQSNTPDDEERFKKDRLNGEKE